MITDSKGDSGWQYEWSESKITLKSKGKNKCMIVKKV